METDFVTVSSILADLPSAAFAVLLVLCRVSAAVMLLPGLGEADPPPTLRIGLAVGITVLVAPPLLHEAPDPAGPPALLALAVVREILCGLFLGMTSRILALSLPIAAELMTLAIGLTRVIQPEPAMGAQSSALNRLFSLAAPVLLLSSGLYRLPLEAVADSYTLVSLGGALPTGDATTLIVRAVTESFSCAARLASPFLVAGLLWEICLAMLTRFVPTLQAGAAMAPGHLLGGVILLAVLGETLLGDWLGTMQAMVSDLLGAFHG